MMVKEIPVMIACDPTFIPFGKVPDDYPKNAHVTGFVFVPPTDEASVDETLKAFLAAGEKYA